ncbi:MAG: SDR family NAD(P)-dependent oxidoreductase [Pirellulales bacterium]|nr:SDR family NAD(P)-dependent oxidoreductase [Pirellulales bacterium]
MQSLRDKRVLITGAAGGIGSAIAKCLARAGASLLLADLQEERLAALADEIRTAGADCRTFALDVTRHESIVALRERVLAEGGPIDVLVNNAGVVFGGAFQDVPLDRHLLTYQVNTLGVVAVAHVFLPDLISRSESHLVNIASASGFIGLPFGATYASSKWAVIGFSDSLRLELAELGHRQVGVTAVCPSYVDTGMFAGVKPPRTTKMLRPERLAALIEAAVRHRRAYVVAPRVAYLSPALKGLLPTGLFDRVGEWFGVNDSMRKWRGHGR